MSAHDFPSLSFSLIFYSHDVSLVASGLNKGNKGWSKVREAASDRRSGIGKKEGESEKWIV